MPKAVLLLFPFMNISTSMYELEQQSIVPKQSVKLCVSNGI